MKNDEGVVKYRPDRSQTLKPAKYTWGSYHAGFGLNRDEMRVRDDMVDAMNLAWDNVAAAPAMTATEVHIHQQSALTANMRGIIDRMIVNTHREMEHNLRKALLAPAPAPLTFMGTKIHFDPIDGPKDRMYFFDPSSWYLPTGIRGKSASGIIIIDDPHNTGARAMSEHRMVLTHDEMAEAGFYPAAGGIMSSAGKALQIVPAKNVKPVKKDYNTIGVRFLQGPNLTKIYTYRIRKGAKVHLGQELVVPSKIDGVIQNSVGVVVEIHKTPQDTGPYEYKFVTGKVQPL